MKFLTNIISVLWVVAISSSSVVKSPEGNFELLILHNNDMHAKFEQVSQQSGTCTQADRDAKKCYGGFARVAHVVKEARAKAQSGEGPPVLYLNAGDTYTGTAWFTIYKWRIAAEFINALQPDAVSLGNHELDNGVSGLTPFIQNVTCPVLAANLNLTQEPDLAAQINLMKSVIFDINGTKIGIVGYLTPDTKVLAIRNNLEYIEEVKAIKEEIQNLKKEGVKIFIALGHSGFTKDLQIAKEVEDIDLVIGGHTNTFLWNGKVPDIEESQGPYPTIVKQASGKLVPAVQAYAYTKYLGQLRMIFNSDGEIVTFDGNPILLNYSVPEDPTVLEIVNRYRSDVIKLTDVVVGNTSVVLDASKCRLQECNMGNLITDAMIYKYVSLYTGEGWTDAPIAIIQGGGIRASIAHLNLPANITKGDLFTVMPFNGNMAKVTINGSGILRMLEHAVNSYNKLRAPGQFLQASGLKVVYDFKMPPGQRVQDVYIRCGICKIPTFLPLNKTQKYNILMPSFLSLGGDGFYVFNYLPSLPLKYDELESTITYLGSHSPVYAGQEERIVIKNIDKLTVNLAYRATSSFIVVFTLPLIIVMKIVTNC